MCSIQHRHFINQSSGSHLSKSQDQEGSPGAGSAQKASGQLQTEIPSPDAQEEVKVASATSNTGQRSVHENWKKPFALNKMCISPEEGHFISWKLEKMQIQNVLAFVIKLETVPHTGKTAILKGSFSCEGFLKASL